MPSLAHPKYRPDIDGLRAIAVLLVIGYHAFPRAIPGGFIGVDVFFVISGYLISSIILGSLAQSRFSFREFYSRRIKRIFPALILVLAACSLAGWFTLTPAEYKQLGKQVAGGAGFVSNFVLWSEAGYFDTAAASKPLLHLWSLGIEEQFYIVWPLLLYVAWKKRFNLAWLMPALILASFSFGLYKSLTDANAAFYWPTTRFWELTMGSALAYITLFHPSRLKKNRLNLGAERSVKPSDFGAVAGVLLVGLGAVVLNRKIVFPGWWALLPTLGAVLLILAGPGSWLNRTILSNRLLVFFGLISYPLYLWHWPLLAFARILDPGVLTREMRMAAILTSVVLAWITFVAIEKPIRLGKHNFAKVTFLLLPMLAIGCGGFATFARDGLPSRFAGLTSQTGIGLTRAVTADPESSADLIQKYINLKIDYRTDARYGTCWLPVGNQIHPDSCTDGKSYFRVKPLIFLWGDSHAARLYPGLRRAVGDGFRLAQYTRNSCPPILDFETASQKAIGIICTPGNSVVLKRIIETKPDIAVLFAVWPQYDGFGTEGQGLNKLDQTISQLIATGVPRVIVVGPAPSWMEDLPRNLLNIYNRVHRVPERTSIGLNPDVQRVDGLMQGLLGTRKGVTYVSAWNAFCNREGCLTRVDEEADGLTTWDYGHLTTPGAEYLARKLPLTR